MKKTHIIIFIISILFVGTASFVVARSGLYSGYNFVGATTKIKLTDANSVTPVATTTPTADIIPIASDIGYLDSWVAGGIFGDGSDGDVVLTASTTLTNDMFYNDLTINGGVVLNSGGYRIFVKGTLTNNGTISNNGASAVKNVAGAGAAGVTLIAGGAGGAGSAGDADDYSGGGGGGGGIVMVFAYNIAVEGTITANGGNGASALYTNNSLSGAANAGTGQANGVTSTAGGAGAGQTPGAGGTVVAVRKVALYNPFLLMPFYDFKNAVALGAGCGGGGGQAQDGGGGDQRRGGGGGGSGGYVILIYKNLITSGTVTASGGNGGLTVNDPGWGNGGNGTDGMVIKYQI